MATTGVSVVTRSRAVWASEETKNVNAPLLAAVVVATCTYGAGERESWRCSATGIEPWPVTAPVTWNPVPKDTRVVDGVIVTPVGACAVVK